MPCVCAPLCASVLITDPGRSIKRQEGGVAGERARVGRGHLSHKKTSKARLRRASRSHTAFEKGDFDFDFCFIRQRPHICFSLYTKYQVERIWRSGCMLNSFVRSIVRCFFSACVWGVIGLLWYFWNRAVSLSRLPQVGACSFPVDKYPPRVVSLVHVHQAYISWRVKCLLCSFAGCLRYDHGWLSLQGKAKKVSPESCLSRTCTPGVYQLTCQVLAVFFRWLSPLWSWMTQLAG